jgi:hypothetical protein
LELLRENDAGRLIRDDALVIGMHQGYDAYWLTTVSKDDSAVYLYRESDTAIRKAWPFFSASPLDQSKLDLGINIARD